MIDLQVPVAAQLVEQHELGGGGSSVRMTMMALLALLLIVTVIVDGIGLGASADGELYGLIYQSRGMYINIDLCEIRSQRPQRSRSVFNGRILISYRKTLISD